MLKVVKQKSKLLSYLNDFLKIGFGMERLLFFLIVFMLLSHLASCLWLIIASLYNRDGSFDGTWLSNYKEYEKENSNLYIVAFYWIISTITTVGYGDISGTNNVERVFCSACMFIGVIAFSIANGSLASII
jgi:Trk-type K+ transport system membrane component